ncbi:uncharacterized protein [Montipora foliosa]|uniref:uncharacterized protein isoform X2 n=1 Tax=Montipora foliosa TaxID=591990 RepID=UPI0035F1685C
MLRQLTVVVFATAVFTWVDCASVPACASMKTWFPGTNPLTLADNLPYQLSVSGNSYYPSSSHTVYLNGSMTNEMKIKSFVGFIVYAENSVSKYPNGRFVAEDLPPGVEEVSCSSLFIVQNSTSAGNWTSVKLIWKAPVDGHLAGNITFRASVVEQTSPQLRYYEGFTAQLGYDACANIKCPFYGNCHPSANQNTTECKCDIICTAIYHPVCGTDGETHGNECAMKSHACVRQKDIKVAYDGECNDACADDKCPFYGNCHPSANQNTTECKCDIICTEIYRPVCGTDGETHGNECAMKSHACVKQKDIKVAYDGECTGAASKPSFSSLSLMMTFLGFLWYFV